jgi:hypothetical protein
MKVFLKGIGMIALMLLGLSALYLVFLLVSGIIYAGGFLTI